MGEASTSAIEKLVNHEQFVTQYLILTDLIIRSPRSVSECNDDAATIERFHELLSEYQKGLARSPPIFVNSDENRGAMSPLRLSRTQIIHGAAACIISASKRYAKTVGEDDPRAMRMAKLMGALGAVGVLEDPNKAMSLLGQVAQTLAVDLPKRHHELLGAFKRLLEEAVD